jgi:hypothetical protein
MREWSGFDGLGIKLDTFRLQFISMDNIPPSSLAMTSALSSIVVYAIELFEFPKEIPIACRSPGVVPLADAPSAAILLVLFMREGGCENNVVRERCFLASSSSSSNFFLPTKIKKTHSG